MKKVVLLFILLTVPFSLFIVVQQVFINEKIQKEMKVLTEKQRTLFEKNKRLIANIAILKSPARIESLAKNNLHLQEISDDKITHISIRSNKGGGNGKNSF